MSRRKRRGRKEADASPPAKLVHEYPDAELGHFRHPGSSMWSAMKYILVLSVLLWWLPTFGQMIAGYIGGRRAGGPWRGVVAAIAPVVFIIFLAWGADRGLLAPWLSSITAFPTAAGSAISTALPPATPYVNFVLAYLNAFVYALRATLAMGSNGYLVTVVFAYIGGILSEQSRREAGASRGTSVGISISQPFFAALRNPSREWESAHPEQFDDLHRIPVANARPAPPPARPKVDAHRVDAGAEEGQGSRRGLPKGQTPAKPEPKAPDPHEKDVAKEIATRKWVERALRQYEAAHRR